MESKVDLSQYTVTVQGKEFITFPGLLREAHAQGLTGVHTELTNQDLTNPVFRATVSFGESKYTGYGDANEGNVAKQVKGALIRMAETRAIARALRFACNIDMTAIEELDANEENIISKKTFDKSETKAFPSAKRNFSSLMKNGPTKEVGPSKPESPAKAPVEEKPKKTFGKRTFVEPKTEPEF